MSNSRGGFAPKGTPTPWHPPPPSNAAKLKTQRLNTGGNPSAVGATASPPNNYVAGAQPSVHDHPHSHQHTPTHTHHHSLSASSGRTLSPSVVVVPTPATQSRSRSLAVWWNTGCGGWIPILAILAVVFFFMCLLIGVGLANSHDHDEMDELRSTVRALKESMHIDSLDSLENPAGVDAANDRPRPQHNADTVRLFLETKTGERGNVPSPWSGPVGDKTRPTVVGKDALAVSRTGAAPSTGGSISAILAQSPNALKDLYVTISSPLSNETVKVSLQDLLGMVRTSDSCESVAYEFTIPKDTPIGTATKMPKQGGIPGFDLRRGMCYQNTCCYLESNVVMFPSQHQLRVVLGRNPETGDTIAHTTLYDVAFRGASCTMYLGMVVAGPIQQ